MLVMREIPSERVPAQTKVSAAGSRCGTACWLHLWLGGLTPTVHAGCLGEERESGGCYSSTIGLWLTQGFNREC